MVYQATKLKKKIVVYESKIEKAVEVSQPDKSRNNATDSADLSGMSFRRQGGGGLSSWRRFFINENEIEAPVEESQQDKSRNNAETENPEYV